LKAKAEVAQLFVARFEHGVMGASLLLQSGRCRLGDGQAGWASKSDHAEFAQLHFDTVAASAGRPAIRR